MHIALELGGVNLKSYILNLKSKEAYKTWENFENIVLKLVKGAAISVEEFHDVGNAIHLDIKEENFVLDKEQKNGEDVI
uniref:Protein kinase domain-containing protein n=1 Tax=Meloidogyne javanica TaxID=6303 RepID=A0A915M082_MELJA